MVKTMGLEVCTCIWTFVPKYNFCIMFIRLVIKSQVLFMSYFFWRLLWIKWVTGWLVDCLRKTVAAVTHFKTLYIGTVKYCIANTHTQVTNKSKFLFFIVGRLGLPCSCCCGWWEVLFEGGIPLLLFHCCSIFDISSCVLSSRNLKHRLIFQLV